MCKLYHRLTFVLFSQTRQTNIKEYHWGISRSCIPPPQQCHPAKALSQTLNRTGNHNSTFPLKSIWAVSGTADINEKSTGVILETSISQWSASLFILAHRALRGDLWWHSSSSVVSQHWIVAVWSLNTPDSTKPFWHLQTRQRGAPWHAVVRRVRMSGRSGDATANLPKYSRYNGEEEKKWRESADEAASRAPGDMKGESVTQGLWLGNVQR